MIRKTVLQKIWIWADLTLVIFTGLFLHNYSLKYPQSDLVGLLILFYLAEVFVVFVSTARTNAGWTTDSDSGHSGVL